MFSLEKLPGLDSSRLRGTFRVAQAAQNYPVGSTDAEAHNPQFEVVTPWGFLTPSVGSTDEKGLIPWGLPTTTTSRIY